MTNEELIEQFSQKYRISKIDLFNIVDAVSEVYPMIVLANLSRNSYTLIQDTGFLAFDLEVSGCYDDMIDAGVENIHPNYQKHFLSYFSRENLIKSFADGKKEVYVELYQKNKMGNYHWVSSHAIRIKDRNGDIMQICLNRVLDDANSKRRASYNEK